MSMKTLAVVTASFAILTAAMTYLYNFESKLDQVEHQFQSFISEYNKNYATYQEYQHRLQVYKDNLVRIDEMNRLNPRAHFGINKFGDFSSDDFAKMLNSNNIFGTKIDFSNKNIKGINYLPKYTVSDPNPADWSAWFPSVFSEGNCTSGWAFAATEAFELMQARREGKSKIITHYSKQQLIDCLFDYGCEGGDTYEAIQYMFKNSARWCTEKQYPYTADKSLCDEVKCTKVGQFVMNVCEDEDCVLGQLQQGAMATMVNADNWQFFQYGILETCDNSKTNHGVLIIGTDGNDYVTARNSWGSDWGEKGNIRLSISPRNNTCGYASAATIPLEEP